MIDKSFYYGQQGDCFLQLEKHFKEIAHEFKSQPNKVFLNPEDFSNSVRGDPKDYTDKDKFYPGDTDREGDYVKGEWKALGISSGTYEGQEFNDYPNAVQHTEEIPIQNQCCFYDSGTKHENW